MRKKVFFFVGILIFGLSACFKPGENIRSFPEEVAIVGFNYELFPPQPTLIIFGMELIAPELLNFEGIYDGDAVVVSFDINYDNQPMIGHTIVTNLQIISRLNMSWAMPTSYVTGDFNDVIENMGIFDVIEYGYENSNIVFFVNFLHTASPDLHFEYEMTFDMDGEDELAPVYIRAKISGESTLPPVQTIVRYAFDMSNFIIQLKYSTKRGFHIRFYVGDEDGEEKFVEMDRPILLQ